MAFRLTPSLSKDVDHAETEEMASRSWPLGRSFPTGHRGCLCTAGGSGATGEPVRRSPPPGIRLALHRPREHVGAHRRRGSGGGRPEHHLSGVRHRRDLEVHQYGHHLDANLRYLPGLVYWRHRHRAVEPEHPLRGLRGIQQPAEHHPGGRRLQVHRWRRDLRERGPGGLPSHRPGPGGPHRSGRGLRGRNRAPLGTGRGSGSVQDHRRGPKLVQHQLHR